MPGGGLAADGRARRDDEEAGQVAHDAPDLLGLEAVIGLRALQGGDPRRER